MVAHLSNTPIRFFFALQYHEDSIEQKEMDCSWSSIAIKWSLIDSRETCYSAPCDVPPLFYWQRGGIKKGAVTRFHGLIIR